MTTQSIHKNNTVTDEYEIHDTMKTFGYPGTIIHEYKHWVVVLRPMQVTLGSLVIISKSDNTRYSELSSNAFKEFELVVKDLECALKSAFDYNKINYMMLMMNDPQVHYHVIPRYSAEKTFQNISYKDEGWPALPDLSAGHKVENDVSDTLRDHIKSFWKTHS